MGYDNYPVMPNKFLTPDGSITTFSGVEVAPADADRADRYRQLDVIAMKFLLPDGSIAAALAIDDSAFASEYVVITRKINGHQLNADVTLTADDIGIPNPLIYKGSLDCAASPNYPAADCGNTYFVSVAGKIGGASGVTVAAGDMVVCNADGTPAGDQATVGAYWNIFEKNVDFGNVTISGGTINGTSIGGTSASTGKFTSVTTDTISESTGGAGVTIDGVTLKDGGSLDITGGTNTFNITNGTASLDVAAGATLDVNANLTVESASAINQDITTDGNPQFTTIELGHASDTTLSRTGSGDIAIEGNAVYRAGGTDVAVADGGTGKSSWTQYSIPYASASTTIAEITPAASSILVTNGSNVPSLSTALPNGVTATTQTLGDNTTKVATDAYVDATAALSRNSKAFAQGVNLTYAGSGSTGIVVADNDNIDFGTGNFTIVWMGSLPDWTPSANTEIFGKWLGNVGWSLEVLANTGYLGLYLNAGPTYKYSTAAPTVVDGTKHTIVAVIVRETASSDGYIRYYVDGLQLGSNVVLAQGVPSTYSNAETLYVSGTVLKRIASTTHCAYTFNRALTAAEVLDLYRNGINYADKWGSQTAVYTSDFSSGTDGFTGTRATADGSIDPLGGADTTWLRFTTDSSNSDHSVRKTLTGISSYKKARISFTYYLPSTNSTVDGFKLITGGGTTIISGLLTTKDTATSVSYEYTTQASITLEFFGYSGANIIYQDAGGDDVFYIKSITVTEIGATLALEPEGIQPVPGQWLDSSTNKLHARYPVSGASLVRKKDTFEIRWTNSWTASSAAQSIGASTDESKAILPTNCYIDSIIGVVSGADIEDITIGDGSDADRWVEVTSGLAAGTYSFALANRISDGTNYELVVTPDASATMSISWTVRGTILQ